MKRRFSLLLRFSCAIAVLFALTAFGQGTVRVSVTSPITVIINGVEQPVPSAGLYQAGLYFAPAGTTDETLFTMLAPSVGIPAGGLLSISTAPTVPVTPAGGLATLQLRGWESAYGATYEDARAHGGATGKSIILTVDTGDPTLPIPDSPANARFPGFLIAVPEPGTIGLFAIGSVLLLFSLRQKTPR